MGAVSFRARTDLRRRVGSSLLLVVAIGIAGGASLTALAGARRAESAVTRFLAYEHPASGGVVADPGLYREVARLPQVAASSLSARFAMARLDGRNRPLENDTLGTVAVSDFGLSRAIIVSGRLPRPDRVEEVVINASAARESHLRVGDRLRFHGFGAEQAERILAGTTEQPTGPRVGARVVGVVRFPTDLSTTQASPGVIYTGTGEAIFTDAFLEKYRDRIAVAGGVFLAVRLVDHPHAATEFQAEVKRLSGGKAFVFLGSDDADVAAQARHATSVEALALLLFGVLAGVVTLTLIAQAFARQVYLESGEHAALRAMGMTRGQLVGSITMRAAALSLAGAALAVGVAILASPLMPIGLARQAEIHPGISIDGPVLAIGLALITALLTGWTALVAWRATKYAGAAMNRQSLPRRSTSRLTRVLNNSGSPPSATVGASMAFDSGRGLNAVPVRTALASAVIAVVVIAGALTFGANLSRLADQPQLQGWNWDVAVGNPHSEDVAKTAIPLLDRNPSVAAFSSIASREEGIAAVNGHPLPLFGIDVVKGPVLVTYLAGRAPRGLDEIALGGRTMTDRHIAIGQRVNVSAGDTKRSMVVTGRVLLTPSVLNNSSPLGRVGVVTGAALRSLDPTAAKNVFLVRFGAGVDNNAALRRLRHDFPGTVLTAVRPSDVENLRRVDRMPALLAALFALIALLIVGNMLVSSVRRRRRDLAVLRTMGFVRRQVTASVLWQATMVAALAIVIGIPLGVIVGRVNWTIVAHQFGLSDAVIVPGARLVAVALGALLAINLIALVPALLATRTPPSGILHTE
jgi:hypothetical protein